MLSRALQVSSVAAGLLCCCLSSVGLEVKGLDRASVLELEVPSGLSLLKCTRAGCFVLAWSSLLSSWCTDELPAVRNTEEETAVPSAAGGCVHWRWEITRLVLWRVHWLYRLTEASKVTSKHDFSSAWLTGMLFRLKIPMT